MEETRHHISRRNKKGSCEDSLKIPSLKTGRISLADIIAATIGEDARSCDNDGEIQSDFSGDYGTCVTGDLPEDLNFSFYFNESSNENTATNNPNISNQDSIHQKPMNDSSQTSDKFRNVPEIDNNSNTGDSFFKEDNAATVFPTTLSFESQFENHDDFFKSLLEPMCETPAPQFKQYTPEMNAEDLNQTFNLSNDSDLEDSMHFVDPDDLTNNTEVDSDHEVPEPRQKKRRLSDITPYSHINHRELDTSQNDLISLLYAETYRPADIEMKSKHKGNTFHRRRSFSGMSGGQRLNRQNGASKLNLRNLDNDNYKTPTMFRARSFSEACQPDKLTPISEGRQLDTSLSSLLGSPNENSQLSNNPFYEDLKCTLLSDLSNSATDDCPKALFDTICEGQKSDVYARERNLQSRFSSLQSKYADEVRDLSSFYRQQSAEVETERFREIHDERFPLSYRNHLNRYYDNLLHMIMERVEKSLQLLSKTKKEKQEMNLTVTQSFRTRPLLSRKAVSMMEEWYTRNYEHPYPSQTAVEALAAAGQITPEQVKKWFANKRNRAKNTRPMNEVVSMKRKRQFSSRW